ncbi:hypothetical protein CgunFtcFv8_025054 [Champsocephalus gunnari]|uniref:Uncharacterized protein n=1 Tax=Champsocephalus gunnari TaxID=52237 RepID=A0AAN8HRE0_CHAGU|nr:hypothetical protein CgunFtcFv8_025054 [Champsocephalus gunnari]
MKLWMMLLILLLHLVVCVSLPAPSKVSISSLNMEHTLSFLPGPGTPPDARFTVQVLRLRKSQWRLLAACAQLTAGQKCNLTRAFKDRYEQYQARVQAFTLSQTSNWTVSEKFLPLTDTVLGPPDVSLSGCGDCLLLRLRVPIAMEISPTYRVHVQRTRDGVQFNLSLPYKEETVITYLQPGVEYCVTVSIWSIFNQNTVSSAPHCAFTSRPPLQELICCDARPAGCSLCSGAAAHSAALLRSAGIYCTEKMPIYNSVIHPSAMPVWQGCAH